MKKSIKSTANNFIKQHSLLDVNYKSLKGAAQSMGYTVIEFNNIFNDEDVETVIQNLRISDAVLKSRGFTYADSNYRLIFVNEDLTEEEKTIVLAHEIGHVVCEHFTAVPIIGKDVREEHEANEFAHYLLNQNPISRSRVSIMRNKKKFIIALAVIALAAAVIASAAYINRQQAYYKDYYVTSTGNKYHKKDCIFVKDKTNVTRLTKEDFEAGKYKACDMCLPDKE